MLKMISNGDTNEASKSSHSSGHHKSHIFHYLTTLMCFILSAFSVSVCLFMNEKTSHLERKMELLEMERLSVLQPVRATLDENATLWDAIDKLLQVVSKQSLRLNVFYSYIY